MMLFLLGWALPLFAEETNGVLQGEVFIVTKSAENIRLGLVQVMLFSEKEITNYVAMRNSRVEAERPDFNADIARLDQQISKLEAGVAVSKDAKEKKREFAAEYHQPDADTSLEDSLIEKFQTQILALRQKRDLVVKANENWPGSSHYFKDLPTPLASTITDADGKFSLEIPKQGKFAVAAHASREILSAKEEYYWMAWESLNGKESANLILGNQNLMSSGSSASVVSTKSD